MLIDLSPLRTNREFRWLYFGQFVSLAGSMMSYIAIPYQIYQLTNNNAMVGSLGLVQLVPMILGSTVGGIYADRLDRQRLLIVSNLVMILIVGLLAANAVLSEPNIVVIFVLAGTLQFLAGFYRPALEAITQQIVTKKEYPSVGALNMFRYSITAVAGPSIGGILIARYGIVTAYVVDALTFLVAIYCLLRMTRIPNAGKSKTTALEDMKEGFLFAWSKPELMGTYIVDIVAMIFAYPIALYPAMAARWGGAEYAGWLFASMSTGAFVATVFSGWTRDVAHTGRGVIFSAIAWGFFLIGTGLTDSFSATFVFLTLAGAADMVSGLFRRIIWNEAIPNRMRGRLSGIEVISYMSGPLLGNARAGYVASLTSVSFSLWSGGILCVVAVLLTAACLPRFWSYRSQT